MEEQWAKKDGATEPFVKGMSLEDYMSKKVLDCSQTPVEEGETEEDLYQSSGNCQLQGLLPRNIDYCMNEIDEESLEDSNQSNLEESTHHLQQKEERGGYRGQEGMNITSYFKHEREEHNCFRVKRMSVSPSKKQEKNPMNGCITIYGSKFGQAAPRKRVGMPEIVTFYGKLGSHKPQKEVACSKERFKKKEAKNAPYRKNQLNLNQLLEYQSRIKKNRASHTHLQQIKISRANRINDRIAHNY